MPNPLSAPRPSRLLRGSTSAIVALASFLVLNGCYQPLLSPDEERSQYDRYDRSRGDYEPQYVEDPFGRREPNIKGRLGGKTG